MSGVIPVVVGAQEGGSPTMGGAGGATSCVAPQADCDESTLTGCEANLLTDVDNCGSCGTRCIGACVDGECHAFERLVTGMSLSPQGSIATNAVNVFALANYFAKDLVRWSALGGGELVFSQGSDFREILAGVDRLYLLGGGGEDLLWSVPYSSGTVASEGIEAKTAVWFYGNLFAVDAHYVPYRLTSSHQRVNVPLPAPLVGGFDVRLATNGSDLVLVSKAYDRGAPDSYTVSYLDGRPDFESWSWRALPAGDGTPIQVRVGNSAVYLDVELPAPDGTDDALIEHELRELTFDGKSKLIAALPGVFDFELVSGRIYASLLRPRNRFSLHVIPLENPELALDVQTSGALSSLTYADSYFYFGDTVQNSLSRLQAWLE